MLHLTFKELLAMQMSAHVHEVVFFLNGFDLGWVDIKEMEG